MPKLLESVILPLADVQLISVTHSVFFESWYFDITLRSFWRIVLTPSTLAVNGWNAAMSNCLRPPAL